MTDNLFPLNNSQREVMLDWLTGYGKDDVNINGLWAYISQNCDLDALEKAFWTIVRDNDALRLCIVKKGLKKMQYFSDFAPFALDRLSVAGRIGFNEAMDDFMNYCFSVYRGRLFEARLVDCQDGGGGLILRIHHLCADGQTMSMIMQELDNIYQQIIAGEKPEKKESYSFITSVNNDIKYCSSESYQNDKKWWRQRFRSLRHFSFPSGRGRGSNKSAAEYIDLPETLYCSLKDYCAEHYLSLQAVVLGLVALTCNSISGKDCFSIYSFCHNRPTKQLKKTMGCLVASMPVFVKINQNESIAEFLERQYKEYLETMSHMQFPISGLIPYMLPISIIRGNNFNYSWLSLSMMDYVAVADSTKIETGLAEHTCLPEDFYLYILESPGKQLRFILEYRTAAATAEKAQYYLQTLQEIVEKALAE